MKREQELLHASQTREAAPGVPIVRDNTPRPFMYSAMTAVPLSRLPGELVERRENGDSTFSTLSTFPTKPPSAPPVPEEPDEYSGAGDQMHTFSTSAIPTHSTRQDFAWVFEYGLEMDAMLLNTPERLDGLALLYGPAVLKGYRLLLKAFEEEGTRTILTIVPDAHSDAAVWGVLYRIPRSVTQTQGDEPTLLEMAHVLPGSGVQAMNVVVHETYRNRTLPCITYGYPDSIAAHQSSAGRPGHSELFVRRLVAIATKQKLPASYIQQVANLSQGTTPSVPNTPIAPTPTHEKHPLVPETSARIEQHTEPLMIPLKKREQETPQVIAFTHERRVPVEFHTQRWFVLFAVYLFCLLLAVLAFAIVQGVGIMGDVLNARLTLLNVPWLVLMYGLLGGCVSGLITLGRHKYSMDVPAFIVVVWFTRPFVGAVLALFAYTLLTSGLFLPANSVRGGQHDAVFLLVGAVAGLCEGWLFRKR